MVNAGLETLKNHAANPAQATAAMVQEALDRSVLLSYHSLHCCRNDLLIVPNEHVRNVLHSCMESSRISLVQ